MKNFFSLNACFLILIFGMFQGHNRSVNTGIHLKKTLLVESFGGKEMKEREIWKFVAPNTNILTV